MSILKVVKLKRKIDDRMLWKGVSFELSAGDIMALKGASGSGKTVMLRTLAGLEPIQGGNIYYNNKLQSDYPMPLYRSKIIYLQQRPSFSAGNVLDSIKKPFEFKIHADKTYNEDLIINYLNILGRKADFLKKETNNLSGGEEQIVALVRSLQLNPQLILLDEATASLDEETSIKLEKLILEWLKDEKRACIWVSHDLKQLERIATKEMSL